MINLQNTREMDYFSMGIVPSEEGGSYHALFFSPDEESPQSICFILPEDVYEYALSSLELMETIGHYLISNVKEIISVYGHPFACYITTSPKGEVDMYVLFGEENSTSVHYEKMNNDEALLCAIWYQLNVLICADYFARNYIYAGNELSHMNINQLEHELHHAVAMEDYAHAAQIRDEIIGKQKNVS